MKRLIRNISYLLLAVTLLPLLSSCNNEDDVIEIFTNKSWKLSRLTTEGSKAQFLPNLWKDENEYNSSMAALKKDGNFTINFEGTELNGQIMGTTLSGRGIRSSFSGTWTVDGKNQAMTISLKLEGAETDPLAKAFVDGLSKTYKYEGSSTSLTLFYKDGQITKVMGFTPR